MNNRQITVPLVTRTALHVGSGQGDAVTDAFVRQDAQGLPIIPGSSLAGALRAMATRLAVPHVNETILAQLISYYDQMDSHLGDLVYLIKLNNKFHVTLYCASGRQHLCELTSKLRYRTQHYLHAYIADLGGMPKAQNEHREIIEACKLGQADRASSIMYDHVINVGKAIIKFVRLREESIEETE